MTVPKTHDYPHTLRPCVRVIVEKEGESALLLLSAYEDFTRLTRVRDVALRLTMTTIKKLRRLDDHKGNLSAVWNTLPTGRDVAAVERAWEAADEYVTSHFFDERSLLDNNTDCLPSNSATIISGTPVDTEEATPASSAEVHSFRCELHKKL